MGISPGFGFKNKDSRPGAILSGCVVFYKHLNLGLSFLICKRVQEFLPRRVVAKLPRPECCVEDNFVVSAFP